MYIYIYTCLVESRIDRSSIYNTIDIQCINVLYMVFGKQFMDDLARGIHREFYDFLERLWIKVPCGSAAQSTAPAFPCRVTSAQRTK